MIVNVDQSESWNGAEGAVWAADQDHFDAAIARYHARLLEAAKIGTRDRVLDIGCGCGQTTCDAARIASAGNALGVDLSEPMLAVARLRADAEGLANVAFEQGDAQVYPFDRGAFDVAISRFGSMFFADPVAAFANIRTALAAGGRLVLVTWQPLERNEWLSEFRAALAMGRTLPSPPVGAPGPFGLADDDSVREILGNAGYDEVDVKDLREPFRAGADVDDAFAFVSRVPVLQGMLQDLDATAATEARARLRATLARHEGSDGVDFGARGWLVTARRG